jgi:hypothetical protein
VWQRCYCAPFPGYAGLLDDYGVRVGQVEVRWKLADPLMNKGEQQPQRAQ